MKIIMQSKEKFFFFFFFPQPLLTFFFIFYSPSFTSGSDHSCALWFVGNCRTSFVLSSAHGNQRQYFHTLLVLSLFSNPNDVTQTTFRICSNDATQGMDAIMLKSRSLTSVLRTDPLFSARLVWWQRGRVKRQEVTSVSLLLHLLGWATNHFILSVAINAAVYRCVLKHLFRSAKTTSVSFWHLELAVSSQLWHAASGG